MLVNATLVPGSSGGGRWYIVGIREELRRWKWESSFGGNSGMGKDKA